LPVLNLEFDDCHNSRELGLNYFFTGDTNFKGLPFVI